MSRIMPHLWYDKEAKEAAELYVSLFDNSRILGVTALGDTPSGDAEVVSFELAGQPFSAISAGPYFSLNPSISLMVECYSIEEVNVIWKVLLEGGTELMPLDAYPFCKWYGWVQDRYGLTWQLMFVEGEKKTQRITPCLLFSNEVCGKAEEAIAYYSNIFANAKTHLVSHYGEGEVAPSPAKVNYAAFELDGYGLCAMDNAMDAEFGFNEAFSFMVGCKNQEEIDYYWEKLSAVPEAEQCGWLKDSYGVSWQIIPDNLENLLFGGELEEIQRVTDAFMKMKKFDLATLERARLGLLDEENKKPISIKIETIVHKPIEEVWKVWTTPQHIMEWNSASPDWYTPSAENDLRVGGTFTSKMSARDGSFSFDFSGVYDEVIPHKKIAYSLGDQRKVIVEFTEREKGVEVVEVFDAEGENSVEMQKQGWQAILDHFKAYCESL